MSPIQQENVIPVIDGALSFLFQIKIRIEFVRFSKNAICPTKGSSDAAAFDLYSVEEVIIPLQMLELYKKYWF